MHEEACPTHASRDCAIYTSNAVAFGAQPVLLVAHSEDGQRWIFLGEEGDPVDAVVSWGSLIDRDDALIELADLPPGWTARRTADGATWTREPSTRRLPRCA